MTDNDREDLITEYTAQMVENACFAVALAKEKQTNAQTVVYVDSDGNDTAVTVYDFKFYVWKSTDTFDRLADELLGSADYGTLLAYYNKVKNESEIEAGTKIKIPVLTEESSSNENHIYAEPDRQENYGIDIALDDDGDFALDGGDLKTVKGKENLTQAIALRLTTSAGKRIRLGAYGIRSTIGEPVAVESYLSGSIEQSIKADPRISGVNELTFAGDGDSLKIEVAYTDINGEPGMYRGDI